MLPDKIEHCIVFMNYWDVSGVFWSFSKCNIKIPHLPADPSSIGTRLAGHWSELALAQRLGSHHPPRLSHTLGETPSQKKWD